MNEKERSNLLNKRINQVGAAIDAVSTTTNYYALIELIKFERKLIDQEEARG